MSAQRYIRDQTAGGGIWVHPDRYKSTAIPSKWYLESWNVPQKDKRSWSCAQSNQEIVRKESGLNYMTIRPNANRDNEQVMNDAMYAIQLNNVQNMLPQDGKKRLVFNGDDKGLNRDIDPEIELELRAASGTRIAGMRNFPSKSTESHCRPIDPEDACAYGRYAPTRDTGSALANVVLGNPRNTGKEYPGMYSKIKECDLETYETKMAHVKLRSVKAPGPTQKGEIITRSQGLENPFQIFRHSGVKTMRSAPAPDNATKELVLNAPVARPNLRLTVLKSFSVTNNQESRPRGQDNMPSASLKMRKGQILKGDMSRPIERPPKYDGTTHRVNGFEKRSIIKAIPTFNTTLQFDDKIDPMYNSGKTTIRTIRKGVRVSAN